MGKEKVMERLDQTERRLRVLNDTGYNSRSIDEAIGVYKGICYTLMDLGLLDKTECNRKISELTAEYELI